MSDKEKIKELKDGQSLIVSQSEESGAEIWLKHNTYFLFEIPMYGGEPRFTESYPMYRIDEMINEYSSWT